MRKIIGFSLLFLASILLATSLSPLASDKVEVVSWTRYNIDSSFDAYEKRYRVLGEVKNTSDENLRIRIGVTWITEKGQIVGNRQDSKVILLNPIRPGEKLPFFAQMLGSDYQIDRVKIHIEESESYTKGPRKFEITQSSRIERDKVTGMLKNNSNEAKTVNGFGVFYNREGKIVDVSQIMTPVPFAELASGESISFEVHVTRKEKQVEKYKIIPW